MEVNEQQGEGKGVFVKDEMLEAVDEEEIDVIDVEQI